MVGKGEFTVKIQSQVLDIVRPWADVQSGDPVRSSSREYYSLGFCGIHFDFPSGEILIEGEDSSIESVDYGVHSPGLNKECSIVCVHGELYTLGPRDVMKVKVEQ